MASRNIVVKNNIRCFKSELCSSLWTSSVFVLYILADLISFLEIQCLQLAGSSSTVFAANLKTSRKQVAKRHFFIASYQILTGKKLSSIWIFVQIFSVPINSSEISLLAAK